MNIFCMERPEDPRGGVPGARRGDGGDRLQGDALHVVRRAFGIESSYFATDGAFHETRELSSVYQWQRAFVFFAFMILQYYERVLDGNARVRSSLVVVVVPDIFLFFAFI